MAPALGLFGINIGGLADPEAMRDAAVHAEAAGFESVWTGEHIVLPDPQAPPSPAPPETAMVDTVASLTWVAAATSTMRLGTGIVILPQRRPAVLAKSLAGLDHLSGGRLIFGYGVGYLPAEMEACDTPMGRRGARADEYLAAMRTLWSGDAVSFDGEFTRFSSVSANPKPAQDHIPVVVGGHSAVAARRAVAHADGWYGFMRDVETTRADLEALRRAADEVERPAHLGRLEISITPAGRLDEAAVQAYAELGVTRLIPQPGGHRDLDAVRTWIDTHAGLWGALD
ncbi:MAG: TIGR03619 family F420-dependent LLM class oxidoreductase [Actinomycetota bacterium]